MSVFTDLKLFPVNSDKTKTVARGSVVYNASVRLNFNVVEGTKGKFVSFPAEKSSKPDADGKDRFFPYITMVDKELKEQFDKFVLDGLNDKVEGIASASESKKTTSKKVNPLL